MKSIRSRGDIQLTIQIASENEELGETLVKEISMLLIKKNRRLVRSGGERIGYRVELISSRHP